MFSLVIPTYNESKNIAVLCEKLVGLFKQAGLSFELIIVDDDSPDRTWQMAESIAVREKCVKVIRRMKEKDLSTAVVTGWEKACGDILGVIDADLQHPPEALIKMLKIMHSDRDVDLVIGSRYIPGGGVSDWSALRIFISRAGTFFSGLLLGDILNKVRDPMSGFFIFRKEVILGCRLEPQGYKILLEILAKGNYKKVSEVPYVFQERVQGGSKLCLKQYVKFFGHILQLSMFSGQLLRLLKYFVAGCFSLCVSALAYFLLNRANVNPGLGFLISLEVSVFAWFMLTELMVFSGKTVFKHGSLFSRLIRFNYDCFFGFTIAMAVFITVSLFLKGTGLTVFFIASILGFSWNFLIGANIRQVKSIYERPSRGTAVEEGYYHEVLNKNKVQRYWHYKKFEVVSRKLGGSPVLDIGSGPGVFLHLNRMHPGLKVNLDYSMEQLRYGRRLNHEASFVQARADKLPFASQSFQTVCLIESIEHLRPEEIRICLPEIMRVLKKGGKAIISTPNYKSIWPVLELAISLLGPVDYRLQHVSRFDMNKLANYITAGGLVVKNKETVFIVSPFFAVMGEQISNLIFSLERKFFPFAGSILVVEAVKE